MQSRRSLLTSTATLTGTTLAGCLGLADEPERHYLDVLNYGDEPHVFAIEVTDETGSALFEREYDLAAGTGDENRVVEGDPARVRVTVDAAEPVTFRWQPPASSDATDCSAATTSSLSIEYDGPAGEGVVPTYGCETVTDG
jgi:hypothetical protein